MVAITYERETIIRTSGEENDFWHVYTCSPSFANKMKKYGLTPTKIERFGDREVAWFFEPPKDWILSLRPKPKLSEKQLEAAVRNAIVMRKALAEARANAAQTAQEGKDSTPPIGATESKETPQA